MAPLIRSLTSVLALAAGFTAAAPSERKQRISIRSVGTESVANSYIVKYKIAAGDNAIKASQAKALELIKQAAPVFAPGRVNNEPTFFNVSDYVALHVYADEDTIHEIGSDSAVEYVETDSVAEIHTTVVQQGAPDGLSRISHRNIEGGNSLTYQYDDSGGQGITAYVIDTGINISHPDFGGRARYGRNLYWDNDDAHDDNGHGTMVASILGGTKFGVAKKVSLVALSVTNLGGGTSWSIVMAAIQWAYDDAKNNNRVGKSVINISIGGSKEADSGGALIDLTNAVVSKGLLIVVSAGNAHADVKDFAPAAAANAITVGAMAQRNDSKSWFSNFGPGVDIFAPGQDIWGADIVLPTNLNPNYPDRIESGTSQAAPHIAGLAAYLMRLENLSTPSAVTNRILQLARASGVTLKRNEPNTTGLIANNGKL